MAHRKVSYEFRGSVRLKSWTMDTPASSHVTPARACRQVTRAGDQILGTKVYTTPGYIEVRGSVRWTMDTPASSHVTPTRA
jgi:hypothetical protein